MDPCHKAMATSQATSWISLISALPSTGSLLSFAPTPATQSLAPISWPLLVHFIFKAPLGAEVQKGRGCPGIRWTQTDPISWAQSLPIRKRSEARHPQILLGAWLPSPRRAAATLLQRPSSRPQGQGVGHAG